MVFNGHGQRKRGKEANLTVHGTENDMTATTVQPVFQVVSSNNSMCKLAANIEAKCEERAK